MSLLASGKQIGNAFAFLFAIYITMDIICVRFLAGSYYNCDTGNYKSTEYTENKPYVVTSLRNCLDYGGDWVQFPLHFDDFFYGFRTLFVISTGEAWVEIMWNGFSRPWLTDSEGTSITENFKLSGLLIILSLILFNFFIVNVFTGVIVDAFYKN